MHIALPDDFTLEVIGSTTSTTEISGCLSSGKMCFYAFNIYFICMTCMMFLRLCLTLVTSLKFRHVYAIIELFCSLCIVDVAVNTGSLMRVSDIFFFILFWVTIHICFGLLTKALKLDSKYFGSKCYTKVIIGVAKKI